MRFFVRLKCLVLSFILLSLTACAMNSVNSLNLREGIHSFKRQNYRSAFIRLMPEAEKGNVDAQYAVGYMYYYGEGVIEDKKKAAVWIKKAADAGQKDAIVAARLLQEEARHPY
ncbi:MAG: SEL1-like repeat protein [Gammaproteobacteria bacterium]|nr:SEL1-like repeat protein [Gammaproteobacteria bacterium]MCH9717446.1 SEL1-like repeat protein [Gammaproteobacteria bacterium]MCH9764041.1 SEL1-like repeat protein [Gammaproteobacteria bacterium]